MAHSFKVVNFGPKPPITSPFLKTAYKNICLMNQNHCIPGNHHLKTHLQHFLLFKVLQNIIKCTLSTTQKTKFKYKIIMLYRKIEIKMIKFPLYPTVKHIYSSLTSMLRWSEKILYFTRMCSFVNRKHLVLISGYLAQQSIFFFLIN